MFSDPDASTLLKLLCDSTSLLFWKMEAKELLVLFLSWLVLLLLFEKMIWLTKSSSNYLFVNNILPIFAFFFWRITFFSLLAYNRLICLTDLIDSLFVIKDASISLFDWPLEYIGDCSYINYVAFVRDVFLTFYAISSFSILIIYNSIWKSTQK